MAEKDDIEFETLLADKRHKELIGTLREIILSVGQDKDGRVVKAIENQEATIKRLIESTRPAPTKQNINVNQAEVVISIEKMGKELLNGLADLKQAVERPRTTTMTVKRNFGGYMTEVVITEC